MTKLIELDIDYIVEEYNKGKSILKLSKELNVSRIVITKRLKDNNINIRDGSDKLYINERNKTMKKERCKCSIEDCSNLSRHDYNNNIPLCSKHHSQMINHGKIFERTIYDKNDYIELENYIKIFSHSKNGNINGEFLIDKDDFEKVKTHKWRIDKQGYAKALIDGKQVSMHRIILSLENNDALVDHINLNKNDNRKENLRIVNAKQNCYNVGLRTTNKSGVKGVCYYGGKYQSAIEMNYKEVNYREMFENFDDAVKQRLIWESELFKQHSNNYNHHTNTIQLSYISHDDNKETYVEVSMDGEILTFSKK